MPKKKKIKPVSSEISERELRLRELTDQSLQLLDQLAEARTQLIESREETEAASGELETLRQQIEQLESAQQLLERTLGDSRRRVRTSRSLRSVGKARAKPGDIDVVYWVPEAQAVDEAWLKAAVKAIHKTRGARCTLVCPKDLESASLEAIDGLTLLAADSPWPGHVFNLAVVSTDAPLVLIMAVGVDLAKSALSELGGLSDESVGFGIPRIEQDGVEASLGLVETEDLELTRCSAAQVDSESGSCDFAAPEAFFIQRAAFQQLGTFDEDLRGPAVLTDYSLRLQQASYRLHALPDCVVSLPAGLDLLPDVCDARDRMLVMARHRHEDLSTALSKNEEVWELPADDFEALAQALFMHLPGATPESTALYAGQVRSLLPAAGASGGGSFDPIPDICDALQAVHQIPCQQVSERVAEICQELQKSVELDRRRQPSEAWAESIRARIQLELEIKATLAEAYDSLTQRTKELAAEIAARDTQIGELDAQLADRDAQLADRDAQLADRDADLADREAQLKEFYGRQADRDKQIEALETAAAQQEERLATLSGEVDAGQAQLRGLDAARASLTQVVGTACQVISAEHRFDKDVSLEALEASVHLISETLTERDKWIVALLDELCSKRLRLRPRKLAPHEQDFIDARRQNRGQPDE